MNDESHTHPEQPDRPASDDRAVAAGFPPDSGPEQRVLKVRPALFRAYPVSTGALCLAPFGVTALLVWLFELGARVNWIIFGAFFAFCGVVLFIWWMKNTVSHALEITNKRTIVRNGLFRRSTSEVMHDHVRNVQIDQTFADRIFGVGKMGISSSGQSGIEVQVDNLPHPDKLKEIVDLYRPM
ncbi:MAG: PH domain-containing protein [Planctomycetota bacterium]